MLIVSKFNDYYDSGAKYGVDKTCVYNRITSSYDLPSSIWNRRKPHEKAITSYYVEKSNGERCLVSGFVIGFCGNFYPAIVISGPTGVDDLVFYEERLYQRWMHKEGIDRARYTRVWGAGRLSGNKEINAFYNPDTYSSLSGIFDKHPVFSVTCDTSGKLIHTVTICPNLRVANFYKIKDAFTGFQDIYMYLSGVIGNTEKDMVDISDSDMLYKKGFDSKSFKKPKGAPERKRKKSPKKGKV